MGSTEKRAKSFGPRGSDDTKQSIAYGEVISRGGGRGKKVGRRRGKKSPIKKMPKNSLGAKQTTGSSAAAEAKGKEKESNGGETLTMACKGRTGRHIVLES